jgi:Protein of unknown function (DUF3631)
VSGLPRDSHAGGNDARPGGLPDVLATGDSTVSTDGAELIEAVAAFLRRYVVLSREQVTTLALWVFHTWAVEAADVTPYIHVSSAEKRSGKTRLLEVLALLVRSPIASANISDAALFRAIESRAPTLLFDEIDSVFGPKARDREDLRGLLNAGYRRGTPALRMGGAKMNELQEFATFCPKVLAGIGKVPDTISDRAITIALKRRTAAEPIERFRHREAEEVSEPLRQGLESLADYHRPALAEARPELPTLGDRAADSWEPLLAIAELVSEEWTERARIAAVVLSGEQDVADETIGVRLLADLRAVFVANGDRLSTAALLQALKADEEAPWADWHGSGLSARRLADLLRPYGITSRSVRLEDGSTPKGYKLEQFADAFDRYLTLEYGLSRRNNATTGMDTGVEAISKTPQEFFVADGKRGANTHEQSVVAHVAFWDAGHESAPLPRLRDDGFAAFLLERHKAGHLTRREAAERIRLHEFARVTVDVAGDGIPFDDADDDIDFGTVQPAPFPVSLHGDWECPCGQEKRKGGLTPVQTVVAMREPQCPFCGRKRRDGWRRRSRPESTTA